MREDGCARTGGILVLVAFAIVAAMVLLPIIGDLNDSAAARDRVKAARIHAEMRADHQASVDYQHEFHMWTTALMAFGGGFTFRDLALVFLVALIAVAAGYMTGRGRPWQ